MAFCHSGGLCQHYKWANERTNATQEREREREEREREREIERGERERERGQQHNGERDMRHASHSAQHNITMRLCWSVQPTTRLLFQPPSKVCRSAEFNIWRDQSSVSTAPTKCGAVWAD